MKKEIKLLKYIAIICSLIFGLHLSTDAQVTVNIPNCANCPTSSASTFGECGTFPYKIVDFDDSNKGNVLLITENGVVFWFGSNSPSITEFTDPYTSLTGINGSRTPMRMDIPVAGVKAVNVAIAGNIGLVLGDDGIIYAWGLDSNFAAVGALTTGLNQQTLVPMTMPSGLTATKMVAFHSTDTQHSQASSEGSVVIIASDGNTYFIGADLGATTNNMNHLSSWTQVTNPAAGVTYTDMWAFELTSLQSGGYVFLEASDGKYYSFGNSGQGPVAFSWGNSSFAPTYNYYAYTSYGVPFTGPPIEMQFPAGTEIAFIQESGAPYTAITTDGKAYNWGGLTNQDPVELTIPTGGGGVPSPTKITAYRANREIFTDVGLFNRGTLNPALYHYFEDPQGDLLLPYFCQDITKMSATHMLSSDGRLYSFFYKSNETTPRYPLETIDGRFDVRNPRPTE